ncbi:MAG: acyltransferase [Prevotella sp.]
MNNSNLLSKAECNALRGLAIIGIALHNYCHWLGFAVKENEYTFTAQKVTDLMGHIMQPDCSLPVHLLSFFGHYGVPVFLFLSAYGLVLKYERQDTAVPVIPFVGSHYRKLFKMMIVGFVAFTMVDAITPGRHHYQAIDIIAQLLMFNNLMPDPDHIIWPGPYWFFGLMLQLYIVYRLMLYRRHWVVGLVLVVACTVVQMFCVPEGDALNRWRYNCVGGMLPFVAGMLTARHIRAGEKGRGIWDIGNNDRILWGAAALAMLFLVFVCQASYYTWYIVPLLVCIGSVAFVKLLPACVLKGLEWMGVISAALFVMHPLVRKIFIPISRHGDVYAGLLLYMVASVFVAWTVDGLLKRMK